MGSENQPFAVPKLKSMYQNPYINQLNFQIGALLIVYRKN